MMRARFARGAALAAACGVLLLGPAAREARGASRLSREEIEKLFADLAEAAKTAKSLQARIRLVEKSRYLEDDEELLVNEGRIWTERPARYRKEITDTESKAGRMKSLLVIGEKDLWMYFPASKEAQHADIEKATKGKSKELVESFMPWLNFDLTQIEEKYRVRVSTDDVPDGVTIREARPGDGEESIGEAKAPEKAYRIEYVPREAELAPNIRSIRIWVDGVHPWPMRVERRTKSSTTTTEMRDLVVDAKLDKKLFDFKPPKGTKIEELTD